jgi:RNA polymerase sigma-70 factor (ECF subfamily)
MNADRLAAGSWRDDDSAKLIATLRPALVKYFLRRCKDAAESEDLAQDVIVRALARLRWSSQDEARGYIFRIAANRWRDRYRRSLTHGIAIDWDEDSEHAGSEDNCPERVLMGREELHRLTVALLDLNERSRDVFILHRLERMKQADIGEAFGISVSAVEKHIAKALVHLAHRLGDHGTP